MSSPTPASSWVPFFERGCLVGWMFLLTINTVIVGLAVELFIMGTALACNRIYLINESTLPLLAAGVLAAPCFAPLARLWIYGVENLHFKVHEAAINRMVEPPESWSHAIMALLDEHTQISRELELLVQLIEEAPGPVERQDRRSEAKAWLKANRTRLDKADIAYAREKLGYLFR